jgi:hypothetical protein
LENHELERLALKTEDDEIVTRQSLLSYRGDILGDLGGHVDRLGHLALELLDAARGRGRPEDESAEDEEAMEVEDQDHEDE